MHEERAKLLASQLWHSEACEPSQLIQPLTAALQAVERETWEQAADIANVFANCMEEDLPHNERIQRLTQQITAQTIARKCRQQAKGAQR